MVYSFAQGAVVPGYKNLPVVKFDSPSWDLDCHKCTQKGNVYLHRTGESVLPSFCVSQADLDSYTPGLILIDTFVCPTTGAIRCGAMYQPLTWHLSDIRCDKGN